MKIKRIADGFLKYWWVYALMMIALTIGEVYIVIHDIWAFQLRHVVFGAFLILLAVLLVAWVVALWRKRFVLVFLGIPATVLVSAIISLPYAMIHAIGTAGEGDDFGKRHPIPSDLSYYEPEDSMQLSRVDSLDSSTWLCVRGGSQGGIYHYVYYSPPLPDGYLYLKCFEATENIPLSEDRVFLRSKNPVKGHSNFGLVGGQGYFMIYEGSFGDYYAVRVEVWFHDDSTGEDRLLNQKIYKMDGWQR